MNRIRINPGDTVPLYLDEREWSLIRQETPISSFMKKRLKQAETKKEGVCVPLTLDDLDELAEIASNASEQESHETKRRIWAGLYARLRTMLDTYTDGEDEFWDAVEEEILCEMGETEPQKYPPGFEERFESVMQDSAHKSLEEINAALERARVDYNRSPQDDLGGMTPEQVYYLVYSNWDDPQSLLQITAGLNYEEVKNTPIYQNASLMIQLLMEEKGKTKATGRGFMNRKFVERLFERMVISKDEKDTIQAMCKVINEFDVTPIHITRVLLGLAGCLKIRNRCFSATRKGEKFIQEKEAGAFFAHLFKTHYTVLNLAYLDGSGVNTPIQTGAAFSFYQLSQRAKDWVQLGPIVNQIVLPTTIEYFEMNRRSIYTRLISPVYHRIIHPLHEFGLVEFRENIEKIRYQYDELFLRTTPLFNRFLHFKL